MKKKYLIYSILPIAALTVLGVGIASAHGLFFGFNNISPDEIANREESMFQNEAQILGISVDEVKNDWAEGKSLKQIMKEKGITQEQVQTRMKELQIQEMKTYLQALVDKNVITQEQANKRLQIVQERLDNGKTGRVFHLGFGKDFSRGFGFGW
jgi:coproporphyrinogen III oxidase-like Fe-S oxidoreductase